MWLKYIAIIFLFYISAILQNSFFAHLNLFGAVPNFIFILFFIFVFFIRQSKNHSGYFAVVFYAILAGLFLDIFSYTYFGVSIISLLLIGVIIKKIQSSLQEKNNNNFPFIYFLLLFIVSFILYDLILNIFINNFNVLGIISGFSQVFFAEIFYNICIASVIFFIYKILFVPNASHQLRLFNK